MPASDAQPETAITRAARAANAGPMAQRAHVADDLRRASAGLRQDAADRREREARAAEAKANEKPAELCPTCGRPYDDAGES